MNTRADLGNTVGRAPFQTNQAGPSLASPTLLSQAGKHIQAVFFLALLTLAFRLSAADYYVDFAGGSDSANGTTTGSAWQHSPWDPNATGNPLAVQSTITGGDTVNFKGGVVYSGTIDFQRNGSVGNPIIIQTAGGWGSGRAILDGGGTLGRAFTAEGTYLVVSGFEIRNYTVAGVRALSHNGDLPADFLTVSNNLIHDINKTGSSYGVAISGFTGGVIVSNEVFNVNDGIKGLYFDLTNLVVWGNKVHDVNTDCSQFSCWGYLVLCFEQHYDDPENGNHNDGIQMLGWPNLLVIANNRFHNIGNSFFIENFGDFTADYSVAIAAGQVYQVITNALYPNSGQFSYNGATYSLGSKFTGVSGVTSGTWVGGPARLKQFASGGKCYLFNNIYYATVNGTVGPGLDNYGEVNSMIAFNNTFLNTFWDNSGRDNWCYLTNGAWWNNLCVDSVRGGINSNGGTAYDDYNQYTNANGNVNFGGGLTLARFQSANPGHEVHSIEGLARFVDPANRDYRLLTGSSGIGKGTNLTALLPDLASIPAKWRPDLSKDALGNPRGVSWDIGAFQYSTNSPTAGPQPPTGLRVVGGG